MLARRGSVKSHSRLQIQSTSLKGGAWVNTGRPTANRYILYIKGVERQSSVDPLDKSRSGRSDCDSSIHGNPRRCVKAKEICRECQLERCASASKPSKVSKRQLLILRLPLAGSSPGKTDCLLI